ncbi:MAG: metal-dependent hydrolase, partial [Candidatus Eremiobacteraeota bacterium]|nr:metal-dependent hydrolase [Candidatus Eremiobacteraeota bacterium]
TTLWNAFSIMFPHGERFFIECVAAYRDRLGDPVLLAEMRGFVAQEALHTREHLAYNAALQSYVDARTLDREVADHLAKVKSELPRLGRLAVTCALEHFTAIMAREVLADPAYLAGAEPSYARLWTWHALEECEHKAVAFDVFSRVARGNRYAIRVTTMMLATTTFVGFTAKHIVKIMQSVRPAQSVRAWAALLSYIFVRPGLARRILIPYLRYYAPGFHPRQIDDRPVVARARSRVESRR